MGTGTYFGDYIYQQLLLRNRYQRDPFKELILHQAQLQLREKAINQKSSNLEKEVQTLKDANDQLRTVVKTLQESREKASGSQLAALEEKTQKQQEEISDLYKTKALQAEELYQRVNECNTAKQSVQLLEKRLEDANNEGSRQQEAVMRLQNEIQDKDGAIALMKQEITSLQSRAAKVEEQLQRQTLEYDQLLQRFLQQKKECGVDLLNEIMKLNDIIKGLQAENERLLRLLAEAKPSTSAEPSGAVPGDSMVMSEVPKKVKYKITAHGAEVYALTFNESGSLFLTASEDKLVKLFDSRFGSEMQVLRGSDRALLCVGCSNDGRLAAAGGTDNVLRLWALDTGRVKHNLTGHTNKVCGVCFASNSQRLVSGSQDRTVKYWDLAKGYAVGTMMCVSSCNDVCVVSDGSAVLSAHFDGHLRVFDPRSTTLQQDVALHSARITGLHLLHDDHRLLTTSRDNTLQIIDLRTYEPIVTLKDDTYRCSADWSRSCASWDGEWVAAGNADGAVCIFSTKTGKLKTSLRAHTSAAVCCSWSGQTGLLASCSRDKENNVVIWSG